MPEPGKPQLVGMVPMTLDNLQYLDMGLVNALFAEELSFVEKSLKEKEKDDTEREINIKWKFKPNLKSNDANEILVSVETSHKLPKSKTNDYRMVLQFDRDSGKPVLKFSRYSADGSKTMFDKEEAEPAKQE